MSRNIEEVIGILWIITGFAARIADCHWWAAVFWVIGSVQMALVLLLTFKEQNNKP